MNKDLRASPSFAERCWMSLGAGLLVFCRDWSGYHRGCSACSPRPIREVWWHLPLEVGAAFGVLQLLGLLDRFKDRSVRPWLAYGLLAVVVGLAAAAIWLVAGP